MRKVWKFPVQLDDRVNVRLPMGSTILTVDMQADELCLWALVNPDQRIHEVRTLRIAGTGHPITDEAVDHLGTFFLHDRALVFHVFEVEPF